MIPTSVLLVPVPGIEAAIGGLRLRLDPTCRHGMPAHVTVLVPFAPPSVLGDGLVDDLAALFGAVAPFEFVLRRTRWFDIDRVLYLEPEPPEPFRQMTVAVAERYPEYPPYEGAFSDVVPHVTVGEAGRYRRRRRAMHRAAAQLAELEPVRSTAREVWLMAIEDARHGWRRRARFPLGVALDERAGAAAVAQ